MKDPWKELKPRADRSENEPLVGNRKAVPSAVARQQGTLPVQDEKDMMDTGFTLRQLGSRAVRFWLGLQVIGLFFQLLLWREASSHLSEFEEVVTDRCSSRDLQQGVCMGPMWNLSAWREAVLPNPSREFSFQFSTMSSPPTFLVTVDPVSMGSSPEEQPPPAPEAALVKEDNLKNVRWTLEIERTVPHGTGMNLNRFHVGRGSVSVEDLSLEAQNAMAQNKRVDWKVRLDARTPPRRKVRYVVYVEDAASPQSHLIHSSSHCAFGRSWKAFNEQSQGHGHRALSWCKFLLGIFLVVGGGLVYLVHSQYEKSNGRVEGYGFHALVAAKFIFQDAPQQVCVVLYILGWYEASGLRCQLCLFRPEHCLYEDPFHFANTVALISILLSSISNQLLIRPVFQKVYTEDDICMHYTVRTSGLCISTLPFTTGICWASRSILPFSTFFHILCAIPCGIGWLSVFALACFPLLVCCDDECV